MKVKIKQIVISKYYIYSWILGVVAFGLFYNHHTIIGSILLFFFMAFSYSDAKNPPVVGQVPDDFDPGSGAV